MILFAQSFCFKRLRLAIEMNVVVQRVVCGLATMHFLSCSPFSLASPTTTMESNDARAVRCNNKQPNGQVHSRISLCID